MDIAELDRAVATYQSSAFSANTIRCYASQRKTYIRFCTQIGVAPVPATTQLLCRYVAHLGKTLCYKSIRQYMNIIRIIHLEWGVQNPLEGDYYLTQTLRGARRVLGDATVQKEPITPELLLSVFNYIDLSTRVGASTWAAALIMFFGLMRRSNVVPVSSAAFDPALHLRRRDITFTGTGAQLYIRWSKTNQYRTIVRVIPLPRIAGHPLCPTNAIYHAFRQTATAHGDGPAFIVTNNQGGNTPLTAHVFWVTLRAALARAGVPTDGLGTHSLRRGGSCYLFNIGTPEARIRELGGWISNAYVRYITANLDSLTQTTASMANAIEANY